MSLLSRLERRFGRLALPNLTAVLLAGQAALFIGQLPSDEAMASVQLRTALIPQLVVEGEWWRLITFMFVPPPTNSLLIIFYFMLIYLFGTTLENHWGAFRYNAYLLVGYLANVAAAFMAWGLWRAQLGVADAAGVASAQLATNQFLYFSLFLAFARLYPDFIINVMFVLPIRVKWLALVAWLGFFVKLVTGDGMERLLVAATLANYLLFFGSEHWRDLRQGQRRRTFQAAAKQAAAAPAHACMVCGRSTNDEPRTLFRYCTKCEGQCCYCPEHIRNHEHVTAEETAAS